jgi:GTP-binding protein
MIKEASYIKSLTHPKDAPEPKPSVLMLGRSNVGKSSFINSLTHRKNLARVSNTPGKTLALNFYLINQLYYIVDAPGYGYAKRSKGMKDGFIEMIERVLLDYPSLVFICLLIDFKVGPTEQDVETYQFLRSMQKDVMIVCTKKDKIPKTRQYKQEKEIMKLLHDPISFFTISNQTKENIATVEEAILSKLEG